jgi:hypothetical protein
MDALEKAPGIIFARRVSEKEGNTIKDRIQFIFGCRGFGETGV